MKKLIFLSLLIVNISFAQSNEKFLMDFLLEDKLKPDNVLSNYNQFDYTNLWSQTKNHKVLGIIGSDHQRIKVKLISIKKDSTNPNKYLVSGKSIVKGTICDFTGIITLEEIKEVEKLHFGVDNKYQNKGIKSQGILIANYEFKENKNQKHSGIFKGQFYSKWYLSSEDQIEYDKIQSIADGYSNNAFIGIWKSYKTGKKKICNWADYRVPKANQDFDVGAGEFSPSKKYHEKGWENYQKAWLYGNQQAKNVELKEWWK
ncbi:hypothetical protein [Aquimarina sp. 2304DJ70-9]|uniref:hypothetical protein n=1 Tax=Aquimarina penaris TaxID=3231044 RepID=UPI0034619FE5